MKSFNDRLAKRDDGGSQISLVLHWLSGVLARPSGLMRRLGRFESAFLRDDLNETSIKTPIFVNGLARSGSTLVLELLAGHASVGSHNYRDFPGIMTPYWWNWFLERAASKVDEPIERSHKDGMMITSRSPEAMEEIVWNNFFPNLHNPMRSNVLVHETNHPDFEAFYTNHIRKILFTRKSSRYCAKGNYNVTRLSYIRKILPDARFVLTIRDPISQISSLMRQHQHFCALGKNDRRVLVQMQRRGHFEFGLDRRPINIGDNALNRDIISLWESGDEVRGWARYWNGLYLYLGRQLSENADLSHSTIVVRFEDLCAKPNELLRVLFDHVELDIDDHQIACMSGRISKPHHDNSDFSEVELEIIRAETAEARSMFGYLDELRSDLR
jgi:hypothetical protein